MRTVKVERVLSDRVLNIYVKYRTAKSELAAA